MTVDFEFQGLHTDRGDGCSIVGAGRSIADLVDCGGSPLPSELGLCTYTPTGAYLYLLETIHESLAVDWQLSIIIST
jgi:hypothetical protein